MSNLLAYIPVLNQRHLDWFVKHPGSHLFLITQAMAEGLAPRLKRNIAAVPTVVMVKMIEALRVVRNVAEFDSAGYNPRIAHDSGWKEWIMPDEDVSHAFAEKYLIPEGCNVRFDRIWARYDMQAVKAMELVIPDLEISTREFDRGIMQRLKGEANNSPDWWRQVAAAAVSAQGEIVVIQHNRHMPTEYEGDVFGDPAINRDAGEKGRSLAFHSEQAVIALCALRGLSLKGAFLYVTTFPCESCAYSIAAAGFSKVFFLDGYSSISASRETLRAAEIQVIRVV